MEIIDAQIHRPEPVTPWDERYTEKERCELDVELAAAAMDAVGVDAAIVHADYGFCAAACRRYPERFAGVVGYYRPFEIVHPDEEIATLRQREGMLAFRLMPGWPYRSQNNFMEGLREGRFAPFFRAAEQHDVPVVLFAPNEMRDVAQVASAFPEMTLIVDHIGMLTPPQWPLDEHLLDELADLLALAQFPNVAVKFSRVPCLSLEAYPFRDIWRRAGLAIVEAFGPDRLMWGSDYTRTKQIRTYAETLAFLLYTNEVSQADREVMFSKAARRWFRWPVLTEGDANA